MTLSSIRRGLSKSEREMCSIGAGYGSYVIVGVIRLSNGISSKCSSSADQALNYHRAYSSFGIANQSKHFMACEGVCAFRLVNIPITLASEIFG